MNLFFTGINVSLMLSPLMVMIFGNSYSGQLSTHTDFRIGLSLPEESTAVTAKQPAIEI